ncbi:cupredoxin domain-containing protein, partial [Varibaculum cambriense]|uniref:cupredoxin domain-containing protein n=1 Tax=Varibaculum cambriense TaxID=184870 RepID=UPI00399B1EA4
MHMRKIAVAFVGAALAVTMTGCVKNDNSAAGDGAAGSTKPIEVKIADDKCELSTNTAPSGTIKFSLNNEGPARNEFEVLAKDKLQIMGEMENLAAGDKRDFTVQLEEGTYYTACKKNMVGSLVGLKEFKVTKGEGIKVSADDKKLHEDAVAKYAAYVKDQAGQLVSATQEFVDAYKAGDNEKAKKLYPLARMHYERIEPTAESFGDLDPKLDVRATDSQLAEDAVGRDWPGGHR